MILLGFTRWFASIFVSVEEDSVRCQVFHICCWADGEASEWPFDDLVGGACYLFHWLCCQRTYVRGLAHIIITSNGRMISLSSDGCGSSSTRWLLARRGTTSRQRMGSQNDGNRSYCRIFHVCICTVYYCNQTLMLIQWERWIDQKISISRQNPAASAFGRCISTPHWHSFHHGNAGEGKSTTIEHIGWQVSRCPVFHYRLQQFLGKPARCHLLKN